MWELNGLRETSRRRSQRRERACDGAGLVVFWGLQGGGQVLFEGVVKILVVFEVFERDVDVGAADGCNADVAVFEDIVEQSA